MTQKTPEYTRRAVQKYRENKDQINLVLDKGIKARIETLTGEKASAYIKKLVMDDLQRMENGADGPQDQEQKPAVSWDHLAEIEKRKAEQDHAELVNAPHTEPAQHGELAKALFYHGEVTKETDTSSATPDALKLQEELERTRAEYERNKQAEQTQEDAEKTRVFNPQDYN